MAGGIIRYGVHKELEAEADRLIHESLVGVTSMEEKRDILTPWKQKDRLDHEVYNPEGIPSASRQGMYNRAWNSEMPHLNARDGIGRARRTGGTLSAFMEEHGSGGFTPDAE